MISVCMIVKNESQILADSLAAIRQHFDDLVVVDTGSTDGSQDIARRFTDQVHHFEWTNDFSAARNHSISLARHDWVLSIDADEVIADVDHEKVLALLKTQPDSVGRVTVRNHVDDDGVMGTVTERISRLFRKSIYHYQGIIHEQIHPVTGKENTPRFSAPIILDHFGYRSDILQAKDKLNRNIQLLDIALAGSPQDAYLHYQRGQSQFLAGDYAQACQSFERSLSLRPDLSLEYVQSAIEGLGYALINSGRYAEAMGLLKYEESCPSTDFRFLKALILMNNGDLQGAVEAFLQCVKMPPGKKEGVNSFKAYHNIGVILECSDMKADAITFYEACGEYPPAMAGIQRLRS